MTDIEITINLKVKNHYQNNTSITIEHEMSETANFDAAAELLTDAIAIASNELKADVYKALDAIMKGDNNGA